MIVLFVVVVKFVFVGLLLVKVLVLIWLFIIILDIWFELIKRVWNIFFGKFVFLKIFLIVKVYWGILEVCFNKFIFFVIKVGVVKWKIC